MFSSLWRKLVGGTREPVAAPKRPKAQLQVETLEDRALPSASPVKCLASPPKSCECKVVHPSCQVKHKCDDNGKGDDKNGDKDQKNKCHRKKKCHHTNNRNNCHNQRWHSCKPQTWKKSHNCSKAG